MAGYGTPGNIANLTPFKPGNQAARRSAYPDRALRIARQATVEAIRTAIACMQDAELPWNDRLAAIKIILAEGLPKKRDAFEALFAAAASGEGFIEVRFVAPDPEGMHSADPAAVIEARPTTNGHAATFSVNLDDC